MNISYIPYIDHMEAQVQILSKVIIFMRNHSYEDTLEYIRALKDSITYNTQ